MFSVAPTSIALACQLLVTAPWSQQAYPGSPLIVIQTISNLAQCGDEGIIDLPAVVSAWRAVHLNKEERDAMLVFIRLPRPRPVDADYVYATCESEGVYYQCQNPRETQDTPRRHQHNAAPTRHAGFNPVSLIASFIGVSGW